MRGLITIILLALSNLFMTIAWYGHLQWKETSWLKHAGIWSIIFFSWGLAFFEYVPLVPKDRFSAAIGWQVTQATKLMTALSYVGSQRYDNDQANNFQLMPSYTVVDLKINHRFDSWSLAAGINNLFNKSYYAYGVTNVALAPSRYNVYPEDRRNAYISAEYRF